MTTGDANTTSTYARCTRRRFLRDTGGVLASTALLGTPATGRAPVRRRRGGRTVAIFGGGIAGLTAAHELAERGFDVTIYERRAWGGKARSTVVPGTAAGGRRPLPSEHGYRVEFGFYQNIPDTMRRIPFGSNPNGVFDNLVEMPQVSFARVGKRNLVLPLGSLDPRPYTPDQVLDMVVAVLVEMQLPPAAVARFAQRLVVFLSSCDERRLGEWEKVSWIDFIGADLYGPDYRKTLGAVPQLVQASKPERTSAKFCAWVFEVLVYSLLGFGSNGPAIRVLNLPTNEAWIDPWLATLQGIGVKLRLAHELTGFETRHGRLSAAHLRTSHGLMTASADYYVCALPVERIRRLWTRELTSADPSLTRMRELETAWMNGIQFYLRERPEILKGDVACWDSPWLASVVPQTQFWSVDFARSYGDGRVHEKLSAVISDWTQPGIIYGKPATDCTPREVVHELWEQIKLHVNKPGEQPTLTDDMLVGSDIDPGMVLREGRLVSEDPLVLPIAGTEQYRPDVSTAIPNLMLCGDYLDGSWEVANMECANYNGRRAANAILQQSGSRETPATTTGPYRPPEWDPLKRLDAQRYKQGQPNPFDSPPLEPTEPLAGALENLGQRLRNLQV